LKDLYELAGRVAVILKARKQTIAVAESSAGGLLSAALLSVPGASAYYAGGGVVYTKAALKAVLDVSRDNMSGMRSQTEPYAQLLARTARDRFGATWGISETGSAGPTATSYKPGHTCVAIAGPDGLDAVQTIETASENRTANMEAFARAALVLLLSRLGEA
jgi:nicotinamide-nucleotide amidase